MHLDFNHRTTDVIDELDSVRDYLDTIERFIHQKARNVAAARKRLGLTEGLTPNEKGGLKGVKGIDVSSWCSPAICADGEYSQSGQ